MANNRFEEQFETKLGWRRSEYIGRLEELGGFEVVGIKDFPSLFPALSPMDLTSDPVIAALKHSIMFLWHETVFAYIYGLSQIAIMGCRATVERSLRVAHYEATGEICGRGTLGKVIGWCEDAGVDSRIVEAARRVGELGNDRAHANLEHDDPVLAYLGGSSREEKFVGGGRRFIYLYQGDARQAVLTTRDLLRTAFGE